MTPAERRRQAARAQLRETSELAALLASSDEDPVTALTARASGCSLPTTSMDRKALRGLKDIILRNAPYNEEYCTQVRKLLSTFPNVTRLLLDGNTGQEKSKKSRKGSSRKSPRKRTDVVDDEVKEYTCLSVHLAETGNVGAFESLFYVDAQSAEWGDSKGRTPLHLAVAGGNLHLVRYVCARAPQCCRILDFDGRLPLHVAVSEASQNDEAPLITSTLLANYPRGMMIRDKDGLLPVHLAAKYGFIAGIRGLLAAHSPLAIERTQNGVGYLPVDFALAQHQEILNLWRGHKGENRVVAFPGTPSTMKERTLPSASSDAGGTNAVKGPLSRKPHDAALHDLGDVAPSSLSFDGDPNNSVQLCMSEGALVARKCQYEECVEMLLMSSLYCRAVFFPREESHEDGVDAIFFLPLHAAVVTRLTMTSWNHLLTMYRSLHSTDVDRDGYTLLHVLASLCRVSENTANHYSDDEIVAMVKDVNAIDPTSSPRLECLGLTPLHIAILNGASPVIVEAFLSCNLEMTKTRWMG